MGAKVSGKGLRTLALLRNPIQNYAWGSIKAFPALLGIMNPGNEPMAELWMGAHPKGPSEVEIDGRWMPLNALIEEAPGAFLGETVSRRFHGELPFLFKVLAAESPLSIQVHPNRQQAREGFSREEAQGIFLQGEERSYRDVNHKPEIVCALSPFEALVGLRPIPEMVSLLERLDRAASKRIGDLLMEGPGGGGLKGFFTALMAMDREEREGVVGAAVRSAAAWADRDPAFSWVSRLNRSFPGDIGVIFPLLLNLVALEPGDAVFLPPGEMHAYLRGAAIELMANSDNVLRGGLTLKHIDIPELLKVASFEPKGVRRVLPSQDDDPGQRRYHTPAEEFELARIEVTPERPFRSPRHRSVEILICVEGEGKARDPGEQRSLSLKQGSSFIVPAAVDHYVIEGRARLYKASCPIHEPNASAGC